MPFTLGTIEDASIAALGKGLVDKACVSRVGNTLEVVVCKDVFLDRLSAGTVPLFELRDTSVGMIKASFRRNRVDCDRAGVVRCDATVPKELSPLT